MTKKPVGAAAKRVPGLDGLRGISILLVLCGHMVGTRGFYNNEAFWGRLGDWGNLGVRVFFVISGYIITYLLIKETRKTGTISIKQFYMRRVLRIFPASYSFLLVVTSLCALGVIAVNRGDLLHAYIYIINFFPSRSWWVGHLWSLSVEEQFYLLWPATLLLLGTRRGLKAAACVLLAAPVIRLATYYLWASQRPTIGNSFQTVADAIATGCILAGYKDELLQRRWFRRLIECRAFFLIPLAAFLLNARGGARLRFAVLETVINVAIALCICRSTLITKDWAGRILNWEPLVFIGVLSYSLYVWQQLFLNRGSSLWINRFPENLMFAFGAALISYYAIEKPFLRLRDRMHDHKAEEVAATRSIPHSSEEPALAVPPSVEVAPSATITAD